MEIEASLQTMTDSAEKPLPEFASPPVNEVVCGVLFKPIDKLLAPYLGVLWERFREEYPTCQEAPPIIPIIELFGKSTSRSKPEFAEIPPLPRVWFVQGNGNGIIQVQRDRFLHNWRKTNSADNYPRYGHVFGMFVKHLGTLREFLSEHKLGVLEPLQYEITYVNHIYQDEGWSTHADVGRVFADFAWRPVEERFLPVAEGIHWRMTFVLPEKMGRLHVSIQSGESHDDHQPLFVFELTARGMATDQSAAKMKAWFDTAHEWIVRGFSDLTDERTQKEVWRKTR